MVAVEVYLGIPTSLFSLPMPAMTAEEDEVIREVDVFLSSSLHLEVLQFPLVPVYTQPMPIKMAKIKPKHRKMELGIGESVEEAEQQTYTSSRVAQSSCLAAGIISNNEMYITEVKTVLQLRPSYKKLQEGKGDSIEYIDDADERDHSDTEAGDGLQQVQLKRKESERAQASRVNSFAYLVQQQDQESWVELEVNNIGSPDAENCFGEMATNMIAE